MLNERFFPPVIDGVANTVFNYAEIIQKDLGNAVVATPEYPVFMTAVTLMLYQV